MHCSACSFAWPEILWIETSEFGQRISIKRHYITYKAAAGAPILNITAIVGPLSNRNSHFALIRNKLQCLCSIQLRLLWKQWNRNGEFHWSWTSGRMNRCAWRRLRVRIPAAGIKFIVPLVLNASDLHLIPFCLSHSNSITVISPVLVPEFLITYIAYTVSVLLFRRLPLKKDPDYLTSGTRLLDAHKQVAEVDEALRT